MTKKRIPVILDTDIGTDIDDTWALGMMINSPELDVKLIVSATGDTLYRAKLIAKFLETIGRSDIPVGIGIPDGPSVEATNGDTHESRLATWVMDYEIHKYPGGIYEDGVRAMAQIIESTKEEITLIAIAPLTNLGDLVRRFPNIPAKCRFVGMHGSIDYGYGNNECVAEYNVKKDVEACRQTFSAPWKAVTITPLDTCEKIVLRGEKYQAVSKSNSPVAHTIIENYRIWGKKKDLSEMDASTCLFDTVAIYLAFSEEWLVMEMMGISVTDEGKTVRDTNGRKMNVAMRWKKLDMFEDFLVRRLTVS